MNKSKNRGLLYTIIVGIIVVIFLLVTLIVQNHENSPASQSSNSENSSIQTSMSIQRKNNSEAQSEKNAVVAKMKKAPKGNYIYLGGSVIYKTNWSQQQIQDYFSKYQSNPVSQYVPISTDLGTKTKFESNRQNEDYEIESQFYNFKVDSGFYTSAYDAYKANPMIDTIR